MVDDKSISGENPVGIFDGQISVEAISPLAIELFNTNDMGRE